MRIDIGEKLSDKSSYWLGSQTDEQLAVPYASMLSTIVETDPFKDPKRKLVHVAVKKILYDVSETLIKKILSFFLGRSRYQAHKTLPPSQRWIVVGQVCGVLAILTNISQPKKEQQDLDVLLIWVFVQWPNLCRLFSNDVLSTKTRHGLFWGSEKGQLIEFVRQMSRFWIKLTLSRAQCRQIKMTCCKRILFESSLSIRIFSQKNYGYCCSQQGHSATRILSNPIQINPFSDAN